MIIIYGTAGLDRTCTLKCIQNFVGSLRTCLFCDITEGNDLALGLNVLHKSGIGYVKSAKYVQCYIYYNTNTHRLALTLSTLIIL